MTYRKVSDIVKACKGDAFNCDLNVDVGKFVNNDGIIDKKCVYVAVCGERFDGNVFAKNAIERGASLVLTEKMLGDDIPFILVKNIRKALSDIARFFRERELDETVLVTGSVGKTTVKELIYSILSKEKAVLKTEGNKNNTVGLPLTILSDHSAKTAVLEAGISENGEMELLSYAAAPDVTVITNIGSMHAEGLKDRNNTAKEKMKCLIYAKEGCVTFVPYGEPLLGGIKNKKTVDLNNTSADVYAKNIISLENGSRFDAFFADGKSIDNIFVPIIGTHGVTDALFAVGVARELFASDESIISGIAEYKTDGLRQNIFRKNGVTVMLDCYNSGPESLCAALEAFDTVAKACDLKKCVLLLGSMLELGDISASEHIRIGKIIAKKGVGGLITLGNEAKNIALGALIGGMTGEIVGFSDCERDEMINYLLNKDFKGGAVLIKGSRKLKMEELLPYIVKEE